MKVNIKGLIKRLDYLKERINDLFNKLEELNESEQEEITVENIEQYFQNDDTFNLSIAVEILEQAEKLDNVLDIIKEKEVNITLFIDCIHYPSISGNTDEEKLAYYNRNIFENEKSRLLNKEDFDLLKEYFK